MYQQRWLEGQSVGESLRDCEGRYAAIAQELRGRSGFTLLDVGANAGYFSLRFAEEFDARVTAVDGDPVLRKELEAAEDVNVRGVHEFLTPRSLAALGRFDVGLCLSVLHHVQWWPTMLRQMRMQCSTLFVELAVIEEVLPKAAAHSEEIERVVADMGGRKIYASPGFDRRHLRPLLMIEGDAVDREDL